MSEQQGHTPGPWTVDLENTFECRVPVVRDSRGMMVARTSGTLIHSETELEGNARLIAAAPDLLAACETYVNEAGISDLLDAIGRAPNLMEAARMAWPGLFAAVAKARGGLG